MDFPITNKKNKKSDFLKEFQYLNIIPYSLALSLLLAGIYIIVMTAEITKHTQ